MGKNVNLNRQILIIGAGAVGLAIAAGLSNKYKNIIVIERHPFFGNETSSRNSEVIHAGIYYPPNSLKAKLCVAGNRLLYDWCRAYNVSHKRIGKYIVAVNQSELDALNNLYQNAIINGVDGIFKLNKSEISEAEPNIKAAAALFSPSTGIVNSHELMYSFEMVAKKNGADFAYNHTVIGIKRINEGYEISVNDTNRNTSKIICDVVINSAGLDSDTIAALAGINVVNSNYQLTYCKGHYFRLKPSKSTETAYVKRLIYPVPPADMSYLGIHLTLELNGEIKLGPDVEWLSGRQKDYSFPTNLKDKFFESANKFLKGISTDNLFPDQTGIRPRLTTQNGGFRDFIIKEETEKELPGFINLIGIESPGLTSCLEIAKLVESYI